jgi:hypothetical protein
VAKEGVAKVVFIRVFETVDVPEATESAFAPGNIVEKSLVFRREDGKNCFETIRVEFPIVGIHADRACGREKGSFS